MANGIAPNSYAALGRRLPEGGGLSMEREGVPTARRAVVNLRYEPENFSSGATVATVQSALRMAEAGDTRSLFALYRDLSVSGSHVYCELSKRKMALLTEEYAILPKDKEDAADVAAAEAVREMIEECEDWTDGLGHLLDGVLWPVSVCEKIFTGGNGENGAGGGRGLRYALKRLVPVNPTLMCFRQPYAWVQTGGPDSSQRVTAALGGAATASPANVMDQPVYDAESWEADLRFYTTDEHGRIIWNWWQSYAADPMRHLVYRGHLMGGARDNFGGPMRAILFWWLLGTLGRDWFARYMERYGSPWPVARTDAANKEAIDFLKTALALSQKVGGLIVDHDTSVELAQAMTDKGAQAYETFLGVCNREISKVIGCQTLSSEAQPTGLGSSVGKLHADVREDVKGFDRVKLGERLRRQLFEPFLLINGIPGRAPRIVWGGESPEEAAATAATVKVLADGGLEPVDEALETLSERVGFGLQRKAAPTGEDLTGGNRDSRGGRGPERLNADGTPNLGHPSDGVALRKAAALGQVYRGALAPVRRIVLESTSREECLEKLSAWYPDWKPARVEAMVEEALQVCAAEGV